MKSLIPIINELQLIFKDFRIKEIELPQIVVVGSQSSGKSSVLESLVRKSFLPRGDGLVTRCPIILQLYQTQGDEDTSNSKNEYFELVVKYSSVDVVKKYFNPLELQTEIQALTNKKAGTNKGIVDSPIIVRVFSPHVVSLTVVDLPGIVKVPVGDQPPNIEDQVMKMIKRYISSENAIILAVCPANADIATSESIKMAKEVDPDGERTLAVITKLDLLGKGVTALKELQGEIVPVKLGLIGVINQSQNELPLEKSIKDVVKDEMDRLNAWYPSLVGRIGSEFLAQRLSELLLEHIKKCLPSLKTRLNNMLEEKLKEKEILGKNQPTNDTEKISLMSELISGFEHTYRAFVEERSELGKKKFSVGPRIADATSKFTDDLNAINPLDKCDPAWIVEQMKCATSHEGLISIECVFKHIIKQKIENYKGPSKNYVDAFYCILRSAVNPALNVCSRFPKLKGAISIEIEKILEEAVKSLKNELLDEWVNEKLIMMYSTDENFNGLLLNGKKPLVKGNGKEINQNNAAIPIVTLGGAKADHVLYISDLVEAFLLSTSYQLTNSWPGKVMYKLYAQTMKKFSSEVRKAIIANFNDIMVEDPQLTMKRRRNEDEINALQKACVVLNNIYGQPLGF